MLNYVADMVCRKTLQENTINIIADECAIGIYFKENEAKIILLISHPIKLIPAIIIVRKRELSLLLINLIIKFIIFDIQNLTYKLLFYK